MRLLHTSDWHLGRTFHGASMHHEQVQMVDAIVAAASEHAVDLVIIAGDLFERAVPPLESVALFDDAISRLRATGARVVAISGNHDSARRVSLHDRLLTEAGVSIRGDVGRVTEPIMIEPADGGAPVAVYALPYLDPSATAAQLANDAEPTTDSAGGRRSRPTHDSVTRHVLSAIRADLQDRGSPRSVVVAHTFITGGASSDSERDLSVGDIEYVGVDAFDGIDYVALGHLHGPQAFDGGRIAYSGSPLAYSFSEERHHKVVRIVELGADGSVSNTPVRLHVGMRLRTLTGRLDDLLADPALADAEQARVKIILTDDDLPHQAMARVRDRFPHAVELRHEPLGRVVNLDRAAIRSRHRDTRPIELLGDFWADQHGAPPTGAQITLLTRALEARSLPETA